MALPLTIFILLASAATFLLAMGVINLGKDKGVAFLPLAGLVFVLTGALLWSTGLQLNQVSGFDTTTSIIGVNYTTITVTDGSPLWLLSNIVFFGGFLLIMSGVANILQLSKLNRMEQEEVY